MSKTMISLAKAFSAALILAAFFGASLAQQTSEATAVRPVALSGDLLDPSSAIDGRNNTRAHSGRGDYVGMSFTIDLGGEQNVTGLSQEHGFWPQHYPGAYRVEVAQSPSGPWFRTFEGAGTRATSKAVWPAIRARYIRVTATALNTLFRDNWSVAEVRASVDPGQTARQIPGTVDNLPDRTRPSNLLRDQAFARDERLDTRATSNTPNYDGYRFTYDLGGEYELSRLVQVHGQWSDDYPSEYKIEVSRENNEDRFREVWRGRGEPGRSSARFNPVITRYIRITALRNRDNQHWWSIAEIRTNRDPDVVEDNDADLRSIQSVTANGFTNITDVLDDRGNRRASTANATYAGSWVQIDLGGSYSVSRVTQVHEPDRTDFPGRYRVQVSENGRQWRTVFEGEGERGKSTASFEPTRARYIRITAITNRNLQNPWTIYRLKVIG